MKRSVVVVTGVTLILVLLFAFAMFMRHMISEYLANMPEPVLTVSAKKIEQRDWANTISSTGRLEAVNGVDISSEVPGRITEILLVPGQKVASGASLVKLDASVQSAQLASAQAKVRLSSLTEKRFRRLRQSKASSQASLDGAIADLAMARANVTLYKRQIEKHDIKAPFSGEVGIARVDLGEYIQPGQIITTLQDLSAMELDFSVPQRFLPDLEVGATIDVKVDAYPDQIFKGILTAIDPKVDGRSGLISLRATVPNERGLLRPGMYAKSAINRPPVKDQLIVPQTAVNFALYGSFVYVINKDDKGDLRVQQVIVEVLDSKNNLSVIKGDLKAGDQVVTIGGFRLSNGSKIKVSDSAYLEAKPAIDKD